MREARSGRDGGDGGGVLDSERWDGEGEGGENCWRRGGGGGIGGGLHREGTGWCHRFQRKQGCPQGHVSRSSGTGGQVASSGEYLSFIYVQSLVHSPVFQISKVCLIEFRRRGKKKKIQEVLVIKEGLKTLLFWTRESLFLFTFIESVISLISSLNSPW